MMRLPILALTVAALTVPVTAADVSTRPVQYRQGDTTMEGYLAWPTGLEGQRPGVLVVHEWYGLNDYARRRTRQLAEMGYVAFAADIYGRGRRAEGAEQAARLSAPFREDRELLRRRARAALEVLKQQGMVDAQNVGAIGFCFGGTTVLELARSGADVDAVVSFHGGLGTPDPNDADNIRGKVLVLHGAADPHVPREEVMAFWKEMSEADVDWQMNAYGGAVHSFTNPASGTDPSTGAAYDEQAAEDSWEAMQLFFADTIGLPGHEAGTLEKIEGFTREKVAKPTRRGAEAVGRKAQEAGRKAKEVAEEAWERVTD